MFPYLDETLVPVINPWVRVSYGALHHSAWAITVSWIIFACTHGYGGISYLIFASWQSISWCSCGHFIFWHYFFFFFFLWTFSGFIHRFLSWKIFLPLSRMSYAVYLIHVNFVITYGAHSRKPFYVSELSLIITSLGILVIAFILASVATVAVEMPFLNLDKLFFPNHSKTSESK